MRYYEPLNFRRICFWGNPSNDHKQNSQPLKQDKVIELNIIMTNYYETPDISSQSLVNWYLFRKNGDYIYGIW